VCAFSCLHVYACMCGCLRTYCIAGPGEPGGPSIHAAPTLLVSKSGVCVCVHVKIHICMSVCMHVCMFVCKYACTGMHVRIYAHVSARQEAGALLSMMCTDSKHGPPALMALSQLLPEVCISGMRP
jgi:hypothetical protein